jgi:hypothetical protein
MIGLRGPYFEWNVSVGAMQNKTVYYKVNLTSPGEIMLSPTAVIFGNETIYGIPGSINVICNQNGICEKDLGENYMTCPQDCLTGALDGLCDLMKDGRCDPDCAQGTDVDCIGQGNNQTISPGNETTVDNETSSNNNSGDETSPGNEIPANITGGETPPKSLLETYWWVLIIVGVLVIILIAVYLKKKSGTSKEASEWKSAYESSPQQNTGPSI